jgi:UDPglucose 6-dehydrogenase
MKVSIIGTGYVGLTTGVCLGYLGHKVTCIDSDHKKIGMLQAGKTPIYEPFLTELMAAAEPNLQFCTDYAGAVKDADVIFIAVGTPPSPDGSPDLKYLRAAAQGIGQHYDGDFLVVVNKSTVPIGSGNWVGSIVRESYEQHHGRKANGHFSVASNPEFLREGTALHDSLYADRVVIGSDNDRALEVLYSLYRPVLDQTFAAPPYLPRPEELGAVPLISTDLASAELMKLECWRRKSARIFPRSLRASAWTPASERASCKPESAGAVPASARILRLWLPRPRNTTSACPSWKPLAKSIAASASAWWTNCWAN